MQKRIATVSGILVEVDSPVRKFPNNIQERSSIEESEEFFRLQYESAKQSGETELATDFDRCRTLLKWASTCNAKLVHTIGALTKEEGCSMRFVFNFPEMRLMQEFITYLNNNVNGPFLA